MRSTLHPLVLVLVLAGCRGGGNAPDAQQGKVVQLAPPPQAVAAPAPDRAPATSPAPFGLTSSDGEGLAFVRLAVSGFVQRPLAFTELRMTFENPSDRVREGRFQITLPPGGSVARFAMRLGDRWQEGEMIERHTAQRIYDDFLHRRQDPALLEHEAGNEFSARVFPIPAHGRKDIILSYSQELSGHEPYRVPLRGLPGLGDYSARVVVKEAAGERVVEAKQSGWVPNADLTVEPVGESAAALRSGRLVVARVTVPGDSTPEEIGSLALLVDTSASRAAGFGAEIALVKALVAELPASTRVLAAAFDQDVEEIHDGPASAFKADALFARRALGATDLGRALSWLRGRMGSKPLARVLIVGDGVVTAGSEGAALVDAAKALAKTGVQRLDAVATGGIRDDASLARLARAGYAHEGLTISGELPVSEILRRLRTAARSGLKVDVAGAGWVQPAILDGVQPGDEVLVHVDAPEDKAFEVLLDGKPALSMQPVAAEPALVSRACAAAKIAFLQSKADALPAADRAAASALRDEILALSTTYRVSSPLTAFLVLETDEDYRRYGIDRTKAGKIWSVGKSGLVAVNRGELDDDSRQELAAEQRALQEQMERAKAAANDRKDAPPRGPGTARKVEIADRPGGNSNPADSKEAAPQALRDGERDERAANKGLLRMLGAVGEAGSEREDSFGGGASSQGIDIAAAMAGAGGVGVANSDTLGIGDLASGGGAGGLGQRRATTIAGRLGRLIDSGGPAVNSPLCDRAAIRRYARSRERAMVTCYERELRRNATLKGKITVGFTIGETGRVMGQPEVVDDTLGSPEVVGCVRNTIRMWVFPFKDHECPVTLPLVFAPAEGQVAPESSSSSPWQPVNSPTEPVVMRLGAIDGPVKREALAADLRGTTQGLHECFWKFDWSKAPPMGEVSFEVRLGISPSGKIDRAGFSPSEPQTLVECLGEKLRSAHLSVHPLEETSATLSLTYSGGAWVDFRPRDGTNSIQPWTGKFAEVMGLIHDGAAAKALELTTGWHEEQPGDVLALVALGEACEATGDKARAARAYGSIIDLFPSRADLRRFAGNRLERVATEGGSAELETDTYRRAAIQRPDHPASHHLLGMALLRAGMPPQAFEAIAAGLAREYPDNRFRGARQILAEDLGLAAAAWKKAEPGWAAQIDEKLAKAGGVAEPESSLRFVLTWETDGNDVDFHIHDRFGDHAFYSTPHLSSGGDLYADVTTGYGPECFTIRNPPQKRAHPYWLNANYYSRGPMGYGMGLIEVIEHDGRGGLSFDPRPLVIMQDQAFVDAGRVDPKKSAR